MESTLPGQADSRSGTSTKKPVLEHWSYDHPANPWLGGGGAYRDWTLLKTLSNRFETRYVSAAFQGCQTRAADWPGTVWIGGGCTPGSARLNWVLEGHQRLHELERTGRLPDLFTTSPSILAPMPCLRRHLDRVVLVVHHFVGWNSWRNVGPLAPLCVAYERAMACRGKHFIVVNRKVEARIRSLNPTARIERIPNGIDASLLETTHAPTDHPSISFVGRLDVEMKGLDRLLDAFDGVVGEIPEARLEIAGRGSVCDVEQLKARIARHPRTGSIALHLDVSDARKAELLSRAWVFASPSRFEGWCIAAVEAQACRLPVVATTADGFLDSVRDGETGVLVDNCEGTVRRDLRDALVSLLRDPARRAVMGEAAHAWASRHTWGSLAIRNERFLMETLEGARR